MTAILLLCICSVLVGTTRVYSATEYRLGGADGNPWQAALTEESVYQVFDADGRPERQMPVGLSPFGVGADTLINYSDT